MQPPSAIVVRGLGVPVVVLLVALIAGALVGALWAFAVLAVGWGALLAYHVVNLDRLASWAAGSRDAEVPEGRGVWAAMFSVLYRRVRSRVAYQRDLTHTIARFQSAAEAIPDGMVVLDADNRIKWANARAQSMLGLDLRHDVGAPLQNLVRQPAFVRYLDVGEYSAAIVIDSQRDPGVTLSIQIVPFGIDEKLLISRDITELEAVARMRRDFIANVSHELKTPLTVISGFVETLQELKLDDGQRVRFLQLMHEQSRSMQRLVEDLLSLSALESEGNPLHDEPFPILPLLLKLSADAKALSQGQHEVKLDIAEPALVIGSQEELASAFGNLVSNAVRYTPSGGVITLSWSIEADGTGAFAVIDTGIGLAAEHIPRLTERFYRVDRSRSRATGGTGLGLAIVKHVLLRHQADLEVVSEPGKGSTFRVRLPAGRVRPIAMETGNPQAHVGSAP
jgi:two-component system phosphate regulon sensor histidine kinase PhoR